MQIAPKRKLSWPFYVTRRLDFGKKKYWAIRIGGIVLAFLVAGIVCTILRPGSFLVFYQEMGRGCFDFTDISTIIDLLSKFIILLLIAIVLTPAFKMKFWNIGAEGQILVGALAAAGIAKFSPSSFPNFLILIFALLGAMGASLIWSVIPALFKAFFKTNETLFTLMLNYIAAVLSAMMISIWIKSGSQVFGILMQGTFPALFGNTSTLVVLIGLLIYAGMFFYINMSKFGYETTVIGNSENTAKYVGINVKKVTIRTMAISGLLFGVIGFFIVCGVHQSFSPVIVGGQGFTGVLVAWLGHFDPLEIALFTFLSAVMGKGTSTAASAIGMSSSQFSAICTGAFFFIIIACEFFSRYQIKIHRESKKEEKA